jgi:hypothetical protein
MHPSRLASAVSLAYLLPLILWLTAQLELNDWAAGQVQATLQQAILVVLAGQCLGMALLNLSADARPLGAEVNGLLLLLLYPLPLLTLSWLSGSLELGALFRLSAAPYLAGGLALGLRRGLLAILPFPLYRTPTLGLLQGTLLILLWHYRQFWLAWSGL